ncbi:SMI1/KNR4 family protein [Lysinibacillus fusiformis]|uniref:SMI1/KNR4 family protein n=1 Tax=Lysinibacillus fusiformis TaxID=28031 RepID=UPI002E1C775A|nr:SMI1/KNR4 family protein [Lysinibacillus fusiformis]
MYENIVKKLAHTTSIKWYPGCNVKDSWITEAELELGFQLPPSYCWWLMNYGNARLIGGNILTVSQPEYRDIDDSDILYIHRLNLADEDWYRKYPNRLDLFVPDADELYFFDLSAKDEDGEFPVMCYDLMNNMIYEYAPTFSDFLERLLDEHR